MRSAHDVDWSEFPPVLGDAFFPEKVAPAIESLRAVTAEAESGPAYQALLYTIANNHGGYLYPASYAAIPLIGEVLNLAGWPRRTALDVLVELARFDVPPTFALRGEEIDFVAAARELFEGLREPVQAIAEGPDDGAGSREAARSFIESLDEQTELEERPPWPEDWLPAADVDPYAASLIHAAFLNVLRTAVQMVNPGNVDRADCIVTGEGSAVCIVIIPHRGLDGVALVAWSTEAHVDLLWAQVTDLGSHDEIDLGVRVRRISRDDPGWAGAIMHSVRLELERPLAIDHIVADHQVVGFRVYVDIDGERHRIGTTTISLSKPLTRRPQRAGSTTLAGNDQPAVSVPPPTTRLRSQA